MLLTLGCLQLSFFFFSFCFEKGVLADSQKRNKPFPEAVSRVLFQF